MQYCYSKTNSIVKKKFLFTFFLLANIVFSQNLPSLVDSVMKYKGTNYQKALDYGFKALNQDSFEEVTYDLVNINYLIGEIYYYQKIYDKSLQYLSQSLSIYESLPLEKRRHKNIKKSPWVLLLLGNVYFENGNFNKAEKFYKEAIENFNLYEEKYRKERINGLNTSENNLAIIGKKLLDFSQAESYYKRILERETQAIKNGNYDTHIIFTYKEIMDLYFISGKDSLGLKYFDLSSEAYEKAKTNNTNPKKTTTNELKSTYSQVVSRYAEYLKNKKQFKKAIEYFEVAKNLIDQFSYDFSDINISISECLIAINDYNQAEELYLETLKNKDLSFKNKIRNFKGLAKLYSIQQRNKDVINIYRSIIKLYYDKGNIINFNDLENQMVIALKEREINESKLKNYRNNYFITVFILLFIIIIIVLVFNSNYQKVKNSKLEAEKKQISIKLEGKNRELVSKANFILQRNEYLKNIKSKLDKSNANEQVFKRISREISELINSEKSYNEFDKTFINVYPEFYKYLNTEFKLSQTYHRLAAYIKMNQSNNEIAKMTGVSIRTVETQRYRLSRKFNLDKNQDLDSFIKDL